MQIKQITKRDEYLLYSLPLVLFAKALNIAPEAVRLWIRKGLPTFEVQGISYINWDAAWEFFQKGAGKKKMLDKLWAQTPRKYLPQVVEFEDEEGQLYWCVPYKPKIETNK